MSIDMRIHRALTAVSGLLVTTGVLAGCSGSSESGSTSSPDAGSGASGSLVTGTQGTPDSDDTQFEDATLVMPHRALEVTASEASTTVDEAKVQELDLGDSELTADEGEEYVVVSIDQGDKPFESDQSATVELVTEEESYDITSAVDDAHDQLLQAVVAVSVPTDSPVSLSITDEDKTAELDVRTGERSEQTNSGATGAYYAGWSGQISGKLESTGVLSSTDPSASPGGPSDVSVSMSLDAVEPRADGWLSSGWAPDGQGYVLLFGVQTNEQIPGAGCSAELDPASSLTFTPDGGQPVPAIGFDAETGEVSDALDGPIAFAIPLDTASGVLTLSPQLTVAQGCQLSTPMSVAELPITLK
ncbi:hypothetical protein EK0264_10100 [Epidermidibacterium keratini]|uniref:Uncharacterized protein n=1 Tax=Epidermidibacterium keratini TaxID=1891644 RepID=A0A7L4YN94_9ACTN|nr:hypothetical protein [Epidermidibacterium keratini]QHC00606.1 hypothetical protein EK0264_10100 [Epidermidibacterium keratini]